MASSAENPPHHLPTPFAATAAPPPTPSAQPSLPTQPTSSDFLSHLLHRLPTSLSLSSRRPSSAAPISAVVTPPPVSLSDTPLSLHSSLLSAATQHGFFHLADHPIPVHLPSAAESTARSLFNLPDDRKQSLFPTNWPLGHDIEDDDDGTATESLCLDDSCSAESTAELDLGPLHEFAREMEKLGISVAEVLAAAAGFDCPNREKLCSLMWISYGSAKPGRVYPYVVGLHYHIRSQKQSVLSDSGWVPVSGPADSLLVTVGDIAQVWSNGKLKKVRGRPVPSNEGKNDSHSITMSLLVTLSIDSTVFPLIPGLVENKEDSYDKDVSTDENTAKQLFTSFSFEDYAWRVYHERLLPKDPLIRYRI